MDDDETAQSADVPRETGDAMPVIHLLAAGLNFGMVLVASRPVFHLPFKALKEVTEARDQLAAGHLKASKQASL